MSDYLDTVIEELLRGIYEPKSGVYSPTLVIGLGGTGLKVVRSLKQCLARHSVQGVKLLGIDSDDSENHKKYAGLPALADDELLLLEPSEALRCLDRADEGFHQYDYIDEFLPDRHGKRQMRLSVREKIQARKGAGQLRRAGKLLFGANVTLGANLQQKFAHARDELEGLHKKLSTKIAGLEFDIGTRIFVISSVSGGTGAGCLIDCLALLRKQYANPAQPVTITAICLLPGTALDTQLSNPADERAVTRGNALGTLRELQALKLGSINKLSFVFDPENAFEYKGGQPLVDDIYLIDNTLADGTEINDWLALCKATGYFMYGLLGTGVGASHAAGAINGVIPDKSLLHAIPRTFNTLGIGVVEYPIARLGARAMQYALHDLLTELTSSKGSAKEADSLLKETNNLLGTRSIDSLRSRLKFTAENVPEAQFADSPVARRQILFKLDDVFLGAARNSMSAIESQLGKYDADLQERRTKIEMDCAEKLEERARLLVTGNQHAACAHFTKLCRHLESLQQDLHADQDRRAKELEAVKKDLASKEKWINVLDAFLDQGLRRKYLQGVRKFLELKLLEKVDVDLAGTLTYMRQKATTIASSVENVRIDIEQFHRLNEERLQKSEIEADELGFIQSAMTATEIRKWQKGVKLPSRTRFVASEIHWETVVRESMAGVSNAIRREFGKLDLVKDGAKDKTLARRLESLNISSQPMMRLVSTAPSGTDLVPQKFVAGAGVDARKSFMSKFTPIGPKKSVAVPTGNPHMVICLQTRHGFGIGHWVGYENAKTYYLEDEWYFHTFPTSVKLPPLEEKSTVEDVSMRAFGIGLMLNSIIVRGNNYYANLLRSGGDKRFHYLVSGDGKNTIASTLTKDGLVEPAARSRRDPDSSHRLGNSMNTALDAMTMPEWAEFARGILIVHEQWVSRIGQDKAADEVRAYAAKVGSGVSKNTSDKRRQQIERIEVALTEYADQLS